MEESRYAQSIIASRNFFAILIGLSLQHILDTERNLDDPIYLNRWPLFLIGTLLFLRFLIGSANHLWKEYIRRPGTTSSQGRVLFDLGFLTLFGALGVVAFYQASVSSFLIWVGVISVSALMWGLIDQCCRPNSDWRFWLWINLAQSGAIILTLILTCYVRIDLPWLRWDLWLVTLAAALVIFLYWDVRKQLGNVSSLKVEAA